MAKKIVALSLTQGHVELLDAECRRRGWPTRSRSALVREIIEKACRQPGDN